MGFAEGFALGFEKAQQKKLMDSIFNSTGPVYGSTSKWNPMFLPPEWEVKSSPPHKKPAPDPMALSNKRRIVLG